MCGESYPASRPAERSSRATPEDAADEGFFNIDYDYKDAEQRAADEENSKVYNNNPLKFF